MIAAPLPEIHSWDAGLVEREYRWPKTGPTLIVNMVLDSQGSAVGADGTSRTLTNEWDRQIMRTLRGGADALLVGSQSLRVEGHFPLPHGTTFVVSRRSAVIAQERSGIVALPSNPSGNLDVSSAIGHIVRAGKQRILCEGGPTLVDALISAELVSILCLSVRVRDAETLYEVVTQKWIPLRDARMESLIASPDENMLFSRWRCASALPTN